MFFMLSPLLILKHCHLAAVVKRLDRAIPQISKYQNNYCFELIYQALDSDLCNALTAPSNFNSGQLQPHSVVYQMGFKPPGYMNF